MSLSSRLLDFIGDSLPDLTIPSKKRAREDEKQVEELKKRFKSLPEQPEHPSSAALKGRLEQLPVEKRDYAATITLQLFLDHFYPNTNFDPFIQSLKNKESLLQALPFVETLLGSLPVEQQRHPDVIKELLSLDLTGDFNDILTVLNKVPEKDRYLNIKMTNVIMKGQQQKLKTSTDRWMRVIQDRLPTGISEVLIEIVKEVLKKSKNFAEYSKKEGAATFFRNRNRLLLDLSLLPTDTESQKRHLSLLQTVPVRGDQTSIFAHIREKDGVLWPQVYQHLNDYVITSLFNGEANINALGRLKPLITTLNLPTYNPLIKNIILAEKTFLDVSKNRFKETILNITPRFRRDFITLLAAVTTPSLKDQANPESLHAFMWNCLEEVTPDQPSSYSFSFLILENAQALFLPKNHPVYTAAHILYSVSNPNALEDPKNPYTVFKNIEERLSTEPLIQLVRFMHNGRIYKFAWHLTELQSSQRQLTFQDVPPFDRDFIERTFLGIETRIDALSDDEKEHLKERELDPEAFLALKNNILNKPFIPSLLKMKGAPADFAPQSLFHLAHSVNYTQSKSAVPLEGKFLTEQEEFLLAFSSSVAGCSTGQNDGLTGYYNTLLKAGLVSGNEQIESHEERVKALVFQSFQTLFVDKLRDEHFLRKIIGLPPEMPVAQASHQTLYLLNRLSKQLGLSHTVTFDLHTGLLYDSLLNQTTQELTVALFSDHFLKEIVQMVSTDIIHGLQQTPPTVSISNIFETLKDSPYPKPENWLESFFTLDSDDNPSGLTELGIDHLLITVKFGVNLDFA